MDEIEHLIDIHGNVRYLGSLAPDPGVIDALLKTTGPSDEWTDAEILAAITDPDRIPSRDIFGDDWICDQLSFGSCNGWATVEAMIREYFLRGFRDCPTRLSGSYIYAHINGGRDQGSALSAGRQAAERYGAPPADMVPANKIYRHQMPPGADEEAAKLKGYLLNPLQSLRALRTALAKRKPCIVAVHAGSNFQRLDANGIAGVDNGRGNHSVCVDDLNMIAGIETFDMPNSWGLRYGERGRARLTKRHFEQTFNVHGFWECRSVIVKD